MPTLVCPACTAELVPSSVLRPPETFEPMTSPSDEVIEVYRRNAALWMSLRGRLIESSWLSAFTELLSPRGQILDIGCGTGQPLATALAAQGFKMTGVDAVPAFIAAAQTALPEARWITGDMRQLDLQRQYDGLLAWHSLFHLPPEDHADMFAIFSRHAKPGAALMFTSGDEAGQRIGELGGDALYHASLSSEGYTALLKRHGFEIVRHVAKDPGCGEATVWLARKTH